MNKRDFCGVIFDLDNTLYPGTSGLFEAIDARVDLFVRRELDLSAREARAQRASWRRRYHLTLVGLMRERGVRPEDYLSFVHDVPVEDYLRPDPLLGRLLAGLPLPKYVFTNGSREHALRVLRRLGAEEAFAGIFDIVFTGYVPKPEAAAYRRVLAAAGLDPRRTIFVDDLVPNLRTAAALGMTTVLRGPDGERSEGIDGVAGDTRGLVDVLRAIVGGEAPGPVSVV